MRAKRASAGEDSIATIRRASARAVAACAIALSSGCAHTFVAEDGSRHIVGLVWLRMQAPAGQAAADNLRVRGFGMSTVSSPAGTSLVLGYSDSNVIVVRDNQCVDVGRLLASPR